MKGCMLPLYHSPSCVHSQVLGMCFGLQCDNKDALPSEHEFESGKRRGESVVSMEGFSPMALCVMTLEDDWEYSLLSHKL